MPLGDRLVRSAHEAFGPKVEAEVAPRYWQAPDQWLDQSAPQHPWRTQVIASEPVRLKGWVTREQLVASVAAQRHLHLLARQERTKVPRADGRDPPPFRA